MARQVNIYEAKTHFSKLVEDVENGETIIVARNNVPVVEMRPIAREPDEIADQLRRLRERIRARTGTTVRKPGESWRDVIDDGHRT